MISPSTMTLLVRTLMMAVTYWWVWCAATLIRLPNRSTRRFERMNRTLRVAQTCPGGSPDRQPPGQTASRLPNDPHRPSRNSESYVLRTSGMTSPRNGCLHAPRGCPPPAGASPFRRPDGTDARTDHPLGWAFHSPTELASLRATRTRAWRVTCRSARRGAWTDPPTPAGWRTCTHSSHTFRGLCSQSWSS